MGLAFWTTYSTNEYFQEINLLNNAPSFTTTNIFVVEYWIDGAFKYGAGMPVYPEEATGGGVLSDKSKDRGLRMRNNGPSAVTCTIYRFEGSWIEDSQTVVPNDNTLTTQRSANYEFPIRVEITP